MKVVCLADKLKGVVPGDRLVVRPTLAQDHRLSDTTLLIVPVVALFEQFGDAVFGKKFSADLPCGGLRGNGFGSIFTELRNGAVVVRVWPGAAWAVKAVGLVEI